MKNKKIKRNKLKKSLTLVLPLVFLAFLGVGGYFKFIRNDVPSLNQEEQKAAEQADVDAAKKRIDEETQDEPLKDDGLQDDVPVVSGPISLTNLTFSQENGLVNSAVSIAGADSGTCTFIFTDGDGRAISKAAKLTAGSCSISVSEAEFTMIGQYNLNVKFGGESISKTVNIS